MRTVIAIPPTIDDVPKIRNIDGISRGGVDADSVDAAVASGVVVASSADETSSNLCQRQKSRA